MSDFVVPTGREDGLPQLALLTGDAIGLEGDPVCETARRIHESDENASSERAWIEHDCADPSQLHESRTFVGEYMEVFPGHYHRYLGLFEQVRGGTLFLRRVEFLGRAAQRTLATVLEQRFFSPLRGTEPRPYEATTLITVAEDLSAPELDDLLDPDLRRQMAAAPVHSSVLL